jgi:hypothetical protein
MQTQGCEEGKSGAPVTVVRVLGVPLGVLQSRGADDIHA